MDIFFCIFWGKTLCTVVQIKKKVAKIQKNRNFDIRFYNLFFKTSKLGVSENVYG
jgi:hypothetical protein